MLYCIEVQRECEGLYVYHQHFKEPPKDKEILDSIADEDIGYDDNYGKFEYYVVG